MNVDPPAGRSGGCGRARWRMHEVPSPAALSRGERRRVRPSHPGRHRARHLPHDVRLDPFHRLGRTAPRPDRLVLPARSRGRASRLAHGTGGGGHRRHAPAHRRRGSGGTRRQLRSLRGALDRHPRPRLPHRAWRQARRPHRRRTGSGSRRRTAGTRRRLGHRQRRAFGRTLGGAGRLERRGVDPARGTEPAGGRPGDASL